MPQEAEQHMISLSMLLAALAVLASLGCWLLVRGLWPAGARDYHMQGAAAEMAEISDRPVARRPVQMIVAMCQYLAPRPGL